MAQVGCVQFIMQLPRHFTILLIKTFYFILFIYIYIYILGPLFWECQTFLLVNEPEKNDLYIPIRNKSAQSIDYRSQLS